MAAEITPNDSNEANRFDLLELDPLPGTETPEPPAWMVTLIAAINAILPVPTAIAFATLRALVEPLRTRAEWLSARPEHQALVRSAKDAKLAEINRAEREGYTAPVATIAASAPVPLSSLITQTPVTHAGNRDATAYTTEPVGESAQEPADNAAPMEARYVRIRTGQHAGEWGVAVRGDAQVGDVVLARAYSGRVSRKRLTMLVSGGAEGIFVCVDTDAAPTTVRAALAATARRAAAARAVASVVANPAVRAAFAPTERQAMPRIVEPTERPTAGTIEAALTDAADEGRRMATAERTTVVAERSSVPVAPLARPALTSTNTRADVAAMIGKREIIAGAFAAGGPDQISWSGRGKGQGRTTLGRVSEALIAAGLEALLPTGPSVEANAGRAVEALKGVSYTTKRVSAPRGAKARWQIGDVTSSATARADDEFGRIALIVDLLEDETLRFEGNMQLAARVRSHFAASQANETLRSEDLTSWLQKLMLRRYHAVKRVANWYVPSAYKTEVRKLVAAIEPLWGVFDVISVTTGEDLCVSIGKGLVSEVSDIEDDYQTALDAARKRAREAVIKLHEAEDAKRERQGRRKIERTPESLAADQDAAAARAKISTSSAATLLERLIDTAARTAGYELALGATATVNAKARIAALRATLEPLCDDTSLRAAMLELS